MRYGKLNAAQKRQVDRALGISMRALVKSAKRGDESFGRGYEAVKYPFSTQRRPSVVELTGEDGQLSMRDRFRLTNMHRDMARNSPTRVSQDQQVRVNVVGNVGGKLVAAFPAGYEDDGAMVQRWFNHTWARHCEFTFGKDFNWLLKTALSSMDADGNLILVFDDGFLTGKRGTGTVRAFEGDEIAALADADFTRHFPASHTQSQGFVYDELGRFTGAFVSSSQRGVEQFQAERGFITLKRDPVDPGAANWLCLGEMRRFNQGRAVSSISAAINCLVDLHEIMASETQAAKINAQLVGQILTEASAESVGPSAFDGEEVEMPETVEFTTKQLSAIGARLDDMPEGKKIDLFDTKRPNPNMEVFAEFLSGLCGGTRGLARVYSTLRAQTSYTAYRGEQAITKPTFEEKQKLLEREVCDPLARMAIRRAVEVGELDVILPNGWEEMLAWKWPRMPEIDEQKAQAALALKLQNGVTTLHRELGAGEYDKILAERQREIADFAALNMTYPGQPNGVATIEEKPEDE